MGMVGRGRRACDDSENCTGAVACLVFDVPFLWTAPCAPCMLFAWKGLCLRASLRRSKRSVGREGGSFFFFCVPKEIAPPVARHAPLPARAPIAIDLVCWYTFGVDA